MLSSPVPWEWGDQGRLKYTHDFRNFTGIARGLVLHEGADVGGPPDTLKRDLQLATGLDFAPSHYTAWRNYSRIFRSLLLATEDEWHSLRVTEVCKELANPTGTPWTIDDFLTFLAPRYYKPSPGRAGYSDSAPKVFPICALLRYLAENLSMTWRQTFDLLIGNGVEGNESESTYASLTPSGYAFTDPEKRQVRELMGYVAQFTFLNWDRETLSLVPAIASDSAFRAKLRSIATPIATGFLADSDLEVMRPGKLPATTLPQITIAAVTSVPMEKDDAEFIEGSPKAGTHMTRERDPRLREAFFAAASGDVSCDVCGLTSELRYPWTAAGTASTRTIIELHHVLPLASKAYAGSTTTADLVALCPSCHKAVHRYYLKWFKSNGVTDFNDKKTAHAVYDAAKKDHRP
jgi:5-methylcytosine-specific restriction endonuclease McrA